MVPHEPLGCRLPEKEVATGYDYMEIMREALDIFEEIVKVQ